MSTDSLALAQQEFMAAMLADEPATAAQWSERYAAGLAVYRNAYRARLVDALRDTYERTARWVGEPAFRQAAAHHAITHPPQSWTLDAVGEGFVETLGALFARDPEVAELAWLEWAMHRCFCAADETAMDARAFAAATAEFAETDWINLRLRFLPGTRQRKMLHDIGGLWRGLAEASVGTAEIRQQEPCHYLVWREGLKPVFMPITALEGQALALMLGGASYGELCEKLAATIGEEHLVAAAGATLGRWLNNGIVAGLSRCKVASPVVD